MFDRSSNPGLREGVWEGQIDESIEIHDPMTMNGTLAKTGILFAILLAMAVVGWNFPNFAAMVGAALGSLILSLVVGFKPRTAPGIGPVVAAAKGYFVGAISVLYASLYKGIVPQALLITAAVFFVMLALYATRIIKVTTTFKMVVIGATLGIALTYLVTLIGGMFSPAFYQLPIYQASPIGIAFSVGVLILAALNLALDFNTIEEGVQLGAPKYMEWYGAWALMVTIVWIYIEALRLLRKLQR
jgi:uncharacterized YccA/Bax inhibitor family protein